MKQFLILLNTERDQILMSIIQNTGIGENKKVEENHFCLVRHIWLGGMTVHNPF